MKNKEKVNVFSERWMTYGLLLILGIFLGWVFFHPSGKEKALTGQSVEDVQETVWTCAMHPQIKVPEPGKCPICGMDLVPLVKNGTADQADPGAIRLTREAAGLANVLTTSVSRQNAVREVRLYGKVQADERRFQSQVSQLPGRIEKLFVNFTGEEITEGQKLAEIYSPELVTAQQELLETARTKQLQPELYEASKEKLRQWKLTDSQIESIESSGKVISNFEVLSGTSGTVTARRVSAGDYVSRGTVLFEIAGLSSVWVVFDAYESDLPFIRRGEKVNFSIQAIPGKEFSGTIAFIDPVIDPVTRVAKVRVDVGNADGRLKPEMFATGIVRSNLKEYHNSIVVPKSAVLWTGKRSIVYVRDQGSDEPVFRLREIGLGPLLGDSYVVTDGLTEGEEIVTNGTFSVDAAAQLEGKPSMMSASGVKTEKIEVSMDFTLQLNSVYEKYVDIKNSLAEDNPNKAAQQAKLLSEALLKVDMNLLSGDAHRKWMEITAVLGKNLSVLKDNADLAKQRFAFEKLSNALYEAISTFGLKGKTVYYQFCPMFDNDRGAYWLSESPEIRNPYFGNEMLTCGENRDTLRF